MMLLTIVAFNRTIIKFLNIVAADIDGLKQDILQYGYLKHFFRVSWTFFAL
jgi:hypothetical protein